MLAESPKQASLLRCGKSLIENSYPTLLKNSPHFYVIHSTLILINNISDNKIHVIKYRGVGKYLRLPKGWTIRGSNPGGARFSAPVQTGPEAHPASCKMSIGSFPRVRCCRSVTLTPHHLLVQRSKIE